MLNLMVPPTIPASVSFSNADYTIARSFCTGASLSVRQTGTLSAARTLTLPAANAVPTGYTISVIDETGTAAWWYPIRITPVGSDTIAGSANFVALDLPYQQVDLRSDGISKWVASKPAIARNDALYWFDDLLNQNVNGANLQAGVFLSTGLSANATFQDATDPVDGNSPGVARVQLQNSAGARIALRCNPNNIVLGAGLWRMEARVWFHTLASTADDYFCQFGFSDVINGEAGDGAYFAYERANSLNWLGATANNNTRTKTDSGIAVATGAWIKLGIEVAADASSVKYFVNGTKLATDNTSNIPAATNRACGIVLGARKTASTGVTDIFSADYWRLLHIPTTGR